LALLRLQLSQFAEVGVVEAVPDGARDVEAVMRLRPNLVVLDVAMPVMDGLEATQRLGVQNDWTTRYKISVTRGGQTASGSWVIQRSTHPRFFVMSDPAALGQTVNVTKGSKIRLGIVGTPSHAPLAIGLYRGEQTSEEFKFASLLHESANQWGELVLESRVPNDAVSSCYVLILAPRDYIRDGQTDDYRYSASICVR
jgi:hypothetical protein